MRHKKESHKCQHDSHNPTYVPRSLKTRLFLQLLFKFLKLSEMCKRIAFLNYCSHKMNKFLIKNIWLVIYIIFIDLLSQFFSISIFGCQAAVLNFMSTCPELNLVQPIYSCLLGSGTKKALEMTSLTFVLLYY